MDVAHSMVVCLCMLAIRLCSLSWAEVSDILVTITITKVINK